MRYLDGFREPVAARALAAQIAETAQGLDRPVKLMEVCGSHTMAIARYALRDLLPEQVRLVSGPGCPVCVTDAGYVDAAIALARRGLSIATFGDLLRVPGSDQSLEQARAEGADIRVVYSPAQALEWAAQDSSRSWVFLAIGFETTTAPLAALTRQLAESGPGNLALLTAFKLVPPALDALVADPELAIDGFLCPAHVSAILGSDAYRPYAEEHGRPCVVAGFEPLDILYGVLGLVQQLVAGESRVVNQYSRVVRPEGNLVAQALIAECFRPVDAPWRGLGVLPMSGLGLRSAYAHLDAELLYDQPVLAGRDHRACRCGDVLKGLIEPQGCKLFGAACHPGHPLGPCMVSSEGSCAAAWKYRRMDA